MKEESFGIMPPWILGALSGTIGLFPAVSLLSKGKNGTEHFIK
jgi:hypothetical protein